jgi:hypothetical protein
MRWTYADGWTACVTTRPFVYLGHLRARGVFSAHVRRPRAHPVLRAGRVPACSGGKPSEGSHDGAIAGGAGTKLRPRLHDCLSPFSKLDMRLFVPLAKEVMLWSAVAATIVQLDAGDIIQDAVGRSRQRLGHMSSG